MKQINGKIFYLTHLVDVTFVSLFLVFIKIGNILFYKIRNLTYYYDVMIIDVTSNKKILYEKKSTDIEENQKAGETFY